MRKPYRLLDHTADLRLSVSAATYPELLRRAVFALADQLADAASVQKRSSRKIRIEEGAKDLLLVRLLQECLFRFDARRFLVRDLSKIRVTPQGLEAILWGETFSARRHRPKSEIKAVTMHGLKVKRKARLWTAEIVLDV